MTLRSEMIIAIVAGLLVLFIAFKFGDIGGGGSGANRQRNPITFWMGVVMTIILIIVALGVLISTFMD